MSYRQRSVIGYKVDVFPATHFSRLANGRCGTRRRLAISYRIYDPPTIASHIRIHIRRCASQSHGALVALSHDTAIFQGHKRNCFPLCLQAIAVLRSQDDGLFVLAKTKSTVSIAADRAKVGKSEVLSELPGSQAGSEGGLRGWSPRGGTSVWMCQK